MTLVFMVGGLDVHRLVQYVKENPDDFSPDPSQCVINVEQEDIRIFGYFSQVEAAKKAGDLYEDCYYFRIESVFPSKGTGTVNTIRVYDVDGTSAQDIVKAQLAARRQERVLLKFMQKYIPGCENCYVLSSGQYIGIRDSRRIVGDFVLTEEQILAREHFDDVVGIGRSNEVAGEHGEGHDPGGHEGDVTDDTVRRAIAELIEYEIPYRILLPRNVENLLAAGKCVSSTHGANKYLRNQPTCIATGEAAGVAAALSARYELSLSEVNVEELRSHIEIGKFTTPVRAR